MNRSSLALGVIRLLLRGMGSCLALTVHPVRLVVRVLALAAQTLMVMLLLLAIRTFTGEIQNFTRTIQQNGAVILVSVHVNDSIYFI